jgi:hypothetical protein
VLDDFHEARSVHVDEGFLDGPVVAVAQQDATPGHADPLVWPVPEIAEDHLQALPIPIDHVHGRQVTHLRKRECGQQKAPAETGAW